MDFKPGDRVRFTRGPLGLVKGNTPLGKFERECVHKGDLGRVVKRGSWNPPPEGWLYVQPDEYMHTDLTVPVHPAMIERVDT
jgi:hypothetical protein